MNEPEAITVLLPDAAPPPSTKWDRERLAFVRLLPTLLKTHEGKFIAIHEERMVDCGDDLLSLASRVYRAFGYIPIYMDRVAEQRVVYRMPSISRDGYEPEA